MSDIDREREERSAPVLISYGTKPDHPKAGPRSSGTKRKSWNSRTTPVDLAGIESFPASDPPSHTPIIGPKSSPKKAKKRLNWL